MSFHIELSNVRLFDVLRNELSGELGSVLGVEGDKIALKLATRRFVASKALAPAALTP